MRILYFLPFLLLASCFSEEKVDIGSSSTFIRYYNGGYNDVPVTIAKTTDSGYIILSNMQLNDGRFKIKLIKTDLEGNNIWTKIYPEFNTTATASLLSRRAFGLLVLADGSYVLTGEDINSTNQSQAMVMTVGSEGNETKVKIYSFGGSVRGKAITENTSNGATGYIVLGEVDNNKDNMVVAEINKSDLNQKWVRSYGSGESILTNKLFLDAKGSVFFGGTVRRDGKTDVRLVKTIQDSQNTDFDLPIGNPAFNESGNDICRFGFGFAVIGTTNEKDGAEGENSIYFQRLAENGRQNGNRVTFSAFTPDGTEVPGSKEGNALAVTQDGGLLLATTVPSSEALGFGRGGKDLYLIKIDAFGTITWQKDIGSRNDDISVATLQADDGGYIILAGTTLAGLKTIMLLKTDINGDIN